MPIYIGMGIPAEYLLASSVMAAPGALVISKIVYPETGEPETSKDIKLSFSKRNRQHVNLFDAISSGASDGMKVAMGAVMIGGMCASLVWTFTLTPALFMVMEHLRAALRKIVFRDK